MCVNDLPKESVHNKYIHYTVQLHWLFFVVFLLFLNLGCKKFRRMKQFVMPTMDWLCFEYIINANDLRLQFSNMRKP